MTQPRVILDPADTTDSGPIASIKVLSYPTPGSTTPPPADSCRTRIFTATMHRTGADAWQILLREDLGGKFGPALGSFPGPKEGDVTMEADTGAIVVYYTGRQEGDLTGPFVAQIERVEIADIWPMPDAALARLRNVTRILSRHFPDLAAELAPYIK